MRNTPKKISKSQQIEIENLQLKEIDKLRKLIDDLATRDTSELFSISEFSEKQRLEAHGLLVVIKRKAKALQNDIQKMQRELYASETAFKNSSHARILLFKLCPLIKTCKEIEKEFKNARSFLTNTLYHKRGVEIEANMVDLLGIFNQIYTLLPNEEITIDNDEIEEASGQPSTEIHPDAVNLLETQSFQDSLVEDGVIKGNSLSPRKKMILIMTVIVTILFIVVCIIIWFSKAIFG